ncbi:MAG: flagellar motor protein MotB [Acidobacteria bacterium]|nr:MAG: flagellar motor protein MotB [Acidobacteriota bacterium]PYY24505.1 MAG: flagellar motor protein MotB [Acidobacteriota bacterium]
MKSRYFLTLPLAAALIVPAAIAQQTTTTTPDKQSAPASQTVAPAAQTQTAPDTNGPNTNSDVNLSAHQPLQPDTHEGFWGKINPFARKKYVQRQMSPIRNRMNELDELTSTNSKNIKDVDSRAQEGLRQANSKADLADQHAVDAGNRAQQAQQSIQVASTRLDTVQQTIGTLDQYQPVSDTEIRFRPGQQKLSPKAKEALDQLAEQMKGQRGTIVQVQGFSSGKGNTAISSSQDMAQSVVRYLVINHDIPLYRIYTIGVGNAPVKTSATAEGPTKRLRGGRVEVALLKNGVADLTQTQNAQNAAPAGGSSYQPNAPQGGVTGSVNRNAPATNQQPTTATQPAGNVNTNSGGQPIPRQ